MKRAVALALILVFGCAGPLTTHALAHIPQIGEHVRAQAPDSPAPSVQASSIPADAISVTVEGFIDADNVGPVMALLKAIDVAGVPDVWIRINSSGGSIMAGFDLITVIRAMHAHTTCVADWRALSMGFQILQACDTRLAIPGAMMMVHLPLSEVQGNEHAFFKELETLLFFRELMVDQMMERFKITRAQLDAELDTHDWYLTTRLALQIGAIDGVIAVRDIPPNVRLERPSAPTTLIPH